MFELLSRTLRALVSTLASGASREAEIFVLRQQLLVLSMLHETPNQASGDR